MLPYVVSTDRSAASLRRWIVESADQLRPYVGAAPASVEDEVAHHRGLLQLLYDAGWTRWGWPEAAGGLGGDERCRATVYDELAAADINLPEAFVLLETLGPVLVQYAPELARRHLPAYLHGDELWGQGFSEPDAGSDLAAVRTRAVAFDSGYRLTGQKVWTTLGQCAQWALVLCRTDDHGAGHHGLSVLWVDLSAPGVEVRAIRAANGRNEFAEMFFDDVAVPGDHLIGKPGEGWTIAMYLLQFERGMYAWGRQAELHRVLRSALRRSPKPGPAATAAVGRATVSITALRTRSASTVSRLAQDETLGPEASIDKLLLSRAEKDTYDAVRLLNPVEFLIGGEPSAQGLRDHWFYSRVTSIFGGAAEIQRGIIAERVLGLPREPRHGR
jgi:alkylation response protein AidB-like acyl-CoA dehydrogenase